MRISVSSKYIILRERPHKLAPVYWNSISQTSLGRRQKDSWCNLWFDVGLASRWSADAIL